MNKTDTSASTLLVFIHGIYRGGLAYYEHAEDMARSAKRKKETLVIAPQYADKEDLDYHRLGNDFLYWKKAEWKDGYASISKEL